MKCPTCQAELVERVGKFGPFICCPSSKPGDNHGTFSKQGSMLHFTGAIGNLLRPHIPTPGWRDQRTLSQLVDDMTNRLLPGGMTDMDRFLEPPDDVACSVNEIDELNYPDDWRNQRPY